MALVLVNCKEANAVNHCFSMSSNPYTFGSTSYEFKVLTVDGDTTSVSSSPTSKIGRSLSGLDLAVGTKIKEKRPVLKDDKEKVYKNFLVILAILQSSSIY